VCLERDGEYEKGDRVLLCVGSYMCGDLGVGVEGEKGVMEETYICERQLGVCEVTRECGGKDGCMSLCVFIALVDRLECLWRRVMCVNVCA